MLGALRRAAALAAGLLILVATSPAASATPAISSGSGEFGAAVDFTTLTLDDLPGNRCVLEVDGTLTLSGTVTGVAAGTTTAVVHAPCSDVATSAPSTFRDIFRFEGSFTGTVGAAPTTGPLIYAGVTHPGGDINALISTPPRHGPCCVPTRWLQWAARTPASSSIGETAQPHVLLRRNVLTSRRWTH